MDSDLSAEIARIEAELAQDAEMRQQQLSQQHQQAAAPPPPQQQQLAQQPPPSQQQQQQFQFGGENPFAPAPSQQQQQQAQAQQQPPQPAGLFNVNASPFTPPQQQQQQQQDFFQQQSFMGGAAGSQVNAGGANAASAANMHSFSKDTDSRSVFVGNLPKGTDGGATTTPEELAQFFGDCGTILNCTVLKDRVTGELKGTAYIEFGDYTAMGRAIDTKNNANFKGSTIIVCVSPPTASFIHFFFNFILCLHVLSSSPSPLPPCGFVLCCVKHT
ncbi:hypothetical protein ABB37_05744 [Leptomonas pyrrhocoris]|uniref:RRM domain-containing protein n=1 Tax=Leptomonas pyrrhocoris TaxID=157538 RepID=A0A0N0VEZ0_LEPPY|nr:hypothetical protein ABB37_05744 [Leptomonas pyrrhocoris]XP_015657714.1 hypothetical protein ABB37_05744 [Leptomonas pyrrhocoris]KPA79274.1 hypothetical protein ABB37_05744 [Leptomonas pyrrhocoris]KPA79275.1 hypothetical protein ABB37_05744 [Leptomonas pyrrhocoris]|eukprot:XP_015657713.1 hypothetical protein ABB37_05744 [Leptomonas pyrrhocoris]